MHPSSTLRMKWFIDTFLVPLKQNISVLDVGSYDVNGSYRHLFVDPKHTYTGLDIVPGPNVDVVASTPYRWQMIENDTYDAVISGQAFEHIEFFWFTMAEIIRVLKPEGYVCIIAPRTQIHHPYPVDTYRFSSDGMCALARYGNLIPLHVSTNLAPAGSSEEWYEDDIGDSMLVAQKPASWSCLVDPATYTYSQADLSALATGFITQDQQDNFEEQL